MCNLTVRYLLDPETAKDTTTQKTQCTTFQLIFAFKKSSKIRYTQIFDVRFIYICCYFSGGSLSPRKRVSFGPYISPEYIDKTLPPSSPVRKGAAAPNKNASTPTSLLKRNLKSKVDQKVKVGYVIIWYAHYMRNIKLSDNFDPNLA